MIITAFNPETDDLEKSYLTDPYAIGTTTLAVRNADRFALNDRLMLGEMGLEKTEVVTVTAAATDGMTLTVSATVYAHSADDPVYRLRFDQVKFYRSTSGVAGVYTPLTTAQNLDVDNANLTTLYDDVSGLTTYFYKVAMYHSISLVESSLSDPISGGGYRRRQVGRIIDEILQEVSDQNEINITRSELLGYFNDVNDDLQLNAGRPYDFLHTRTALSRTANTNYLDFPTNAYSEQTMWKFDRMDYNFTDTATDPDTDSTSTITVIPAVQFRNLYSDNTIAATTVTDAMPTAMCLDTSVDRFRFSAPFATSAANVFYLHYWKFFDEIDSEGDVIETPSPKIYKLYAKGMYYRKRAITESSYNATADRYFADYTVEKNKYKPADRKDQGTTRSFRPSSDKVN